MTSSTDQLIKESHKAIRRGEKDEARRLLREAAQRNPADHRAWLGLAAVARTPRESLAFIEKAAEISPNNPAVQQARRWAESKVAALPQSEPKTQPHPPTAKPLRQEPAAAPPPIKIESAPAESRFSFRRLFAGVVMLGLIVAIGIAAWLTYTALQGSEVAGSEASEPVVVPTAAEIASLPDTQVSNILPDEEPEIATAVDETATPNPLQPKNIVQESGEPRPRWTETPLPTATPTPSPTWVPTFVSPITEDNILKPIGLSPNERWIDVDLSEQSLVALEGDTPVFQTLVSTGLASYPTVTGQFRIWLRYRSQTMDGTRLGYDYYLENVEFVQYFFEDYALHGTYWHSNFGNPMSHGCVNLSNPDAEWLYNFADYGTVVNVHE